MGNIPLDALSSWRGGGDSTTGALGFVPIRCLGFCATSLYFLFVGIIETYK